MSIIKRKNQNNYFILSNQSVQNDLESLGAIGLLAYIVSLPSDFTLYKTFLFKKFKRAAVTHAWNELVAKKYICGFIAYINRRKTYFYLASDTPLSKEDYYDFLEVTCSEQVDLGATPKSIKEMPENAYTISTDEIEHYPILSLLFKNNSSESTVDNQHLQRNIDKVNINKVNTKDIVNKKPYKFSDEDFTDQCKDIIAELYPKYAPGLYSKKEWLTVTNKLVFEMQRNKLICSDLPAYIESCIKTICRRRERKLGINVPEYNGKIYNWLEN